MSTAENEIVLKGSCYCVKGKPILSAFCHCTLCQRLAGAPCVATVHFPADVFTWTHPQPHEATLDMYSVADKPWKNRFRCKSCGACVASYSTTKLKYSIWAGQLERDEHGRTKNWDIVKPTAHMFYDTRMLDVNDGLPKWEGYEGQSKRLDSVESK
ncbi:hypothetical protein BT96DRAFT_960815 [Gymnopus androsaceus JB14]|uniref:CENP-V/GFA domain-containing protein n=1 Tax=Gymnopus androsaceus JB14 TaxID=1447944 RepID=A0A6A4GI60_9AGAR|nr:hypothetical protein BT96DRAFT_960815 [Gymnopus androsaceus JB14]